MTKRKDYKKLDNSKPRYMRHRREWTEEEVEYLKDKYGSMNTETIAKILKRTTLAVKRKADATLKNLNIYEAQGNYSLIELGEALGNSNSIIIRSWIKIHKMPTVVIKNERGTITNYIIDINNFWSWLKKNKENVSIDMRKVRLGVLDFYPDWFLKDFKEEKSYSKRKLKKWSEAEFTLLNVMYYEKQSSIREIALALDRSYNSVADKIAREAKNRLTRIA